MFLPFLIQMKFFLDIETFYGKSEQSIGDYCLWRVGDVSRSESDLSLLTGGLLVCLEQRALISQAVAAARAWRRV